RRHAGLHHQPRLQGGGKILPRHPTLLSEITSETSHFSGAGMALRGGAATGFQGPTPWRLAAPATERLGDAPRRNPTRLQRFCKLAHFGTPLREPARRLATYEILRASSVLRFCRCSTTGRTCLNLSASTCSVIS